MTWVRQRTPAHHCPLPGYKPHSFDHIVVADGQPGDLWRCDECGMLWRIITVAWAKAHWWQRIRFLLAGRTKPSQGKK